MPNRSSTDEQNGGLSGSAATYLQKSGLKAGALQNAIFNSAYFSSIATDERGVIQIFNVGAERMLGYAAVDVVNKITPADISDSAELIARARSLSAELSTPIEPGFEALVFKASRGIEDIYELTYIRKDGSRFPALVSVTSLRDERDAIIGYLLIGTDNTARKLVEAERERLDQRIQEKNLELEQASRMKSEFLATMSHELRTPLTGMLGMLELLARTPLDAEQAETLQIARDSGLGLVRIINDVLDHARIEAGKLEISLQPVSISRLLRQVVNTYQAVANAGDLVLMQSVDPRISPWLLADPLRVAQILNNLVSNGLKFTTEGHVELSARMQSRTDTTETIVLQVHDTGIGIHPDVQQRLFQPFEQAGAATTLLYGGAGLGLSICRRLADLMGGSISVASMPGEGTTMSVVLKLDVSTEESQAENAAASAPHVSPMFSADMHGSAPVVLAIDDHPANRALLTRQLLALGLRVRTAVDGVEGIALWRKGGISLVITDCNMPRMDGYDFTRALRKIEVAEGKARTPVIGWTIHGHAGTAERCATADMDGVLIKPANLAALKARLEEWLSATPVGLLAQVDNAIVESGIESPYTFVELDKLASSDSERSEILLDYMVQMRASVMSLEEMLRLEDWPACARICHRMKGASGMIGVRDLVVACTVAEESARANKAARLRTAKDAIDVALAILETHLFDTKAI